MHKKEPQNTCHEYMSVSTQTEYTSVNKKTFKQKIIYFLLLCCLGFAVVGCGSLPQPPEVYLCAYSYKFEKFICASNKDDKVTKELKLDDPSMEGAQAMSLEDFKLFVDYVGVLKRLAEQRCK